MKKMLVFMVPVLIAGAVAGLGLAGVVNIPGLTPKKKVATKVTPKVEKPRAKPKPKADEKPKVTGDPIKGFETVAGLWNEMPTPKLLDITAKWTDKDLGPILLRMDPDKVVDYLGQLKADRAASLTREIQKLAETG